MSKLVDEIENVEIESSESIIAYFNAIKRLNALISKGWTSEGSKIELTYDDSAFSYISPTKKVLSEYVN